MPYAIAMYDIASNRRRARVSDLLLDFGPRVQQSVFELDVTHDRDLETLRSNIANLIDLSEDQVRLYQLPPATRPIILGSHTLQERIPYLIL